MILPFSAGRVAWMAVPLALLVAGSPIWLTRRLGAMRSGGSLPHSDSSWWLKLDREGIHVHMLLRNETYRGRDIEGFMVAGLEHGPMPLVRFVGINFRTALIAGLVRRFGRV